MINFTIRTASIVHYFTKGYNLLDRLATHGKIEIMNMRMVAVNIIEIHREYDVMQCPHCWALFRDQRAEFIKNFENIPTVEYGVICPACGDVSFIFDWMDTENIERS